jgi:hypothetical protein
MGAVLAGKYPGVSSITYDSRPCWGKLLVGGTVEVAASPVPALEMRL